MIVPLPTCPLCASSTAWPKRTEISFYHGPSMRNDGPPGFTLEAMRRLEGINAHHFECRGDPKLHGKADLRVCVDWGEDTTEYSEFFPLAPRAYWVSDTHLDEAARAYRVQKAEKMDFVWFSIRHDRELFEAVMRERGISHYWMLCAWLPYAAEPTLWQPAEHQEKKWDLGWIGHVSNYPERTEFLSQLSDEFGERFRFALDHQWFENAVSWLQPCWFVVNHGRADSTNMRTFEGMALGGVVLQPQTSDLEELGFRDGEHLVTYQSADEAIEKVRHYLARPDDMARIGENARRAILAGHTWVHRAVKIAGLTGWTPPPGAVERAITAPPWKLMETRTWEGNR